jgi:hypothetical protein
MALITDLDLAFCQDLLTLSFDVDAVIEREREAESHASGRAVRPVRQQIPVRCTISDNSTESETLEGGKLVSRAYATILLPVGTQVSPADKITSGSAKYEVLAVDTGRSRGLCIEVAARRLDL